MYDSIVYSVAMLEDKDLSILTKIFVFTIIVITMIAIVNCILLIRMVVKRLLEGKYEKKLKMACDTTVDEVLGELDKFISDVYQQELILSGDISLGKKDAKTNEELCKKVSQKVTDNISDIFVFKLSLFYNIDKLSDIISERVVLFNIMNNLNGFSQENE